MAIYMWREEETLNTPGIYHNEAEGLISLSSDGENWITIADKNLGATQVYNDGNALTNANCGNYYQWGNNYGWDGATSATTTKTNISGYGPGNYLVSNSFVSHGTSSGNWIYTPESHTNTRDLWGGYTNTNESKQGPCPAGFHISSQTEFNNLFNTVGTICGVSGYQNIKTPFCTYLKVPKAGALISAGSKAGQIEDVGIRAFRRTATDASATNPYAIRAFCFMDTSTWTAISATASYGNGSNIRPFKNEPVAPTSERTVLYQPN